MNGEMYELPEGWRLAPCAFAPFFEQHWIVAKIENLFAQAEAIERAVEAARRRHIIARR